MAQPKRIGKIRKTRKDTYMLWLGVEKYYIPPIVISFNFKESCSNSKESNTIQYKTKHRDMTTWALDAMYK